MSARALLAPGDDATITPIMDSLPATQNAETEI